MRFNGEIARAEAARVYTNSLFTRNAGFNGFFVVLSDRQLAAQTILEARTSLKGTHHGPGTGRAEPEARLQTPGGAGCWAIGIRRPALVEIPLWPGAGAALAAGVERLRRGEERVPSPTPTLPAPQVRVGLAAHLHPEPATPTPPPDATGTRFPAPQVQAWPTLDEEQYLWSLIDNLVEKIERRLNNTNTEICP